MGKQEKHTGADIGIVICLKIKGISYFRPFRFQAKKVNSAGRADIRHPKEDAWGQARKLLDSGIGHYLFYFQRDPQRTDLPTVPPPIVQSVETILTNSLYPSNIDTTQESEDLATFMLRHLCRAEPDKHDYPTIDEAIGRLLENHEDPPSGVVAFGNVSQAFRLDRKMEKAIHNITSKIPAAAEPRYEKDGPLHRPDPVPSSGMKR